MAGDLLYAFVALLIIFGSAWLTWKAVQFTWYGAITFFRAAKQKPGSVTAFFILWVVAAPIMLVLSFILGAFLAFLARSLDEDDGRDGRQDARWQDQADDGPDERLSIDTDAVAPRTSA